MAWLAVKQLAKYAPGHLRRVAGRIVVAMLPHLPEAASSPAERAAIGAGAGGDATTSPPPRRTTPRSRRT